MTADAAAAPAEVLAAASRAVAPPSVGVAEVADAPAAFGGAAAEPIHSHQPPNAARGVAQNGGGGRDGRGRQPREQPRQPQQRRRVRRAERRRRRPARRRRLDLDRHAAR